MKRFWAVVIAAFVAFSSASVTQAQAADGPRVVCDPDTNTCYTLATNGGGNKSDGNNTQARTCHLGTQFVPCDTVEGHFDSATGCYVRVTDPRRVSGPVRKEYDDAGGSIVFASCPFGGSGGFLWRPPAKPVVTAAMVRAQVARLIPTAALGLAPKTATLVNIQTVMWVDAPAEQNLPAVQILGQRVLIHLTADTVRYDFGDGRSENGPVGKPYDQTHDPCKSPLCANYFGHVYTDRGVRTVSATAYWHASFTVDGGQRVQIPATVPGPTSTASVRVREARAVLVPTP